MQHASLISLNIGRPQLLVKNGRQYSTSINRRPVEGPLELGMEGLAGDRVSDLKFHGGPDKAVCCYPSEHYPHWRARLGTPMEVPSFGEGFTTRGLLETEVCVGDVFRVGTATVEISQPRQPCSTLANKHDEPRLIAWVNETGYCGFYFRVLEAGRVQTGDALTLHDRPYPDLTIAMLFTTMLQKTADAALLRRLANLPELSQSWRERFRRAPARHRPRS